MSEFLDRIAKAIAGPEWHELPAPVREVRRHEARAAIAAMREPTTDMDIAGWGKATRDIEDGAPGAIRAVWQAMIDAALRESW